MRKEITLSIFLEPWNMQLNSTDNPAFIMKSGSRVEATDLVDIDKRVMKIGDIKCEIISTKAISDNVVELVLVGSISKTRQQRYKKYLLENGWAKEKNAA